MKILLVGLLFFGSLWAQQTSTSNTDCEATGPNSINCTTTTTTTPQHAPANTTPETSQAARQIGYTGGTLLGSIVQRARMKRAVNKICFDQHAEYAISADGQTKINCADWMQAHPRKAKKDKPVEIDPAVLAGVCSQPGATYAIAPDGRKVSCWIWRSRQLKAAR